jgi:2-polyprenyl-6-hydroxyphenyl methylase/3-demethylubiquinone-9 3-methyltransferase
VLSKEEKDIKQAIEGDLDEVDRAIEDHKGGSEISVPHPSFLMHNTLTMNTTPKNTICVWFEKDAEGAAQFYAKTFPDSKVTNTIYAPSDSPDGKKGNVLGVEFVVCGIPCMGLNGWPMFKQGETFSFQIATDTQEETDRYWNAIVGNGGKESDCGWCKDKWGVSWQITPRTLTEALAAGGAEAKRAFDAMMTMQKIDVATIDAARKNG